MESTQDGSPKKDGPPIPNHNYNLRFRSPEKQKYEEQKLEKSQLDTDVDSLDDLNETTESQSYAKGDTKSVDERESKESGSKSEPNYHSQSSLDETDGIHANEKTVPIGKPESSPQPSSRKEHNSSLILKLSLIIAFFAIIYMYIAHGYGITISSFVTQYTGNVNADTTNERPLSHRYGNLTKELKVITERYASSGFDDEFWDLIGGSAYSHIQDDSEIKQPVVLMLVGQKGSTNLNAVAEDIAKLFSRVFTVGSDNEFLPIDGDKEAVKKMEQAKLDMDTQLREAFEKGGKVALVSGFDKLPACSVMLFHSYCDNDNAPYKDAVIIFTVQLDRTLGAGANSEEIEEAAQEHLEKAWSQCPEELTQDKIVAIHSRVSNNIAFVL